jgi:hypothetical protein
MHTTAFAAEFAPLPERGAGFSADAWGVYTKQILLAGYPQHAAVIDTITVAVEVTASENASVGIRKTENGYLLVMGRGWINAVRTPTEFLLICGHELAHVIHEHPPRPRIFVELAFSSLQTEDFLRITAEEMEADLFGALRVHGMTTSEGVCTMYDTLTYLFPLGYRERQPNERELWHMHQRLDILARWCRFAKGEEAELSFLLKEEDE